MRMRLRDYLDFFSWSQAKLSKEAGVSPQCIARALDGKAITRRNADAIMAAIQRKCRELGLREGISMASIEGLVVSELTRMQTRQTMSRSNHAEPAEALLDGHVLPFLPMRERKPLPDMTAQERVDWFLRQQEALGDFCIALQEALKRREMNGQKSQQMPNERDCEQFLAQATDLLAGLEELQAEALQMFGELEVEQSED